MFKRHISKRTIATVATVLAAAITTQWLLIPQIQWDKYVVADKVYPTNPDTISTTNYESILGLAIDYGIVSPELTQVGHMETTFATQNFIHVSNNNDVDFLDSNAYARFIVGAIDQNEGTGNIVLGTTTAQRLIFEGPSSYYTTPEGNSFRDIYPNWGANGPYFDLQKKPIPPVAYRVNENASSAVDNIITSVGDRSETLATNARQYSITNNNVSTSEFVSISNGVVTIDVTDPYFENRVVYVNVTEEMLSAMFADASRLKIYKDPTSVIVFNIDDQVVEDALGEGATLNTNKYMVYETNGNVMSSNTRPYGEEAPWDASNVSYKVIDDELCQRIVWNIMTDNPVNLNNFAGLMLIPNSSQVTFTGGNVSGWLVTGAPVNTNNIEFHYVFNGRTLSEDEYNFRVQKRFTNTYRPYADFVDGNPYSESVYLTGGEFSFIWQEYNNYDFDNHICTDPYGDPFTGVVPSSGVVEFPALSFFSDSAHAGTHYYVAPNTDKYFNFRITEANAGSMVSVDGKTISVSSGYVNIRLRVHADADGRMTRYVQYESYNGDGSLYNQIVNGIIDSTSDADWRFFDGHTFNLGGFFNLVDRSSLCINKTISIPEGSDLASLGDITFNIDPPVNGVSSLVLNPDNPGEGWSVSNGVFSYRFANATPDTYTVTETIGAAPTGSTLVIDSQSDTSPKTVEVTASTAALAEFNNIYRDSSYGSITLGKIVDGLGTDSLKSDQYFEFLVYYLDSNGNKVYLTYDNGNGVTSTSQGDWNPIHIYPGQTITLTGSAVPADKVFYIEEVGRNSAALINDNGQPITEVYRFVNGGTHTYTSTSIAQTDASGSTSVTGRSTSVNLGTTGTASCVFTNIYDGGSTPTGAEITISKQNRNGDSLSGATLQLTGSNASGDISFADVTVTGADDVSRDGNALTFKTNGSNVVVSNLPDGTYTLDELTAPGGYDEAADITFTITNGIVDNMTNNTVVMVDEQSTAPTPTGTIKVSKELNNAPAGTSSTTLFSFTILGSDGNYYNANGQSIGQTLTNDGFITVSVDGPREISGLPTGITYTIEEVTGSGQGHNTAYRDGYDLSGTQRVSTVSATTAGTSVTLVNTYTKREGSIQIDKTVTGYTGTALTFTFDIFAGSVTTGTTPYDTVTITTDATTGTGTATLNNVPNGMYTIVERDASQTGYTLQTTYTVDGTQDTDSGSVQVTTGGTSVVSVTNAYTSTTQEGTLKINKSITLLNGASMSNIGDITFTITCPDGTSLIVNYNDFTNGSWSRDNMPIGQYSVAETTTLPSGSTYTVTTTVDNATQTLINGGTVVFNFTNTYDAGSAQPTPTTPTPTDTVTPTPTDSVTPTPTGTDETTPVPTSSEETTPTETTPTESDSQETQPAGPATGAIIISKTISGAPLNELETITFVLTDTACGATREVPALTMENVANGLWGDAGNGTYYCIIDGLSAGVTYTIVESLDGHTSTYSLDAASSVTSASVAVVANDTVGVTLTDAYTTGGTTESSETVPTESSTDATESSNATEGTTETAPDVESVTLSGAVINSNYYTVNSDGTITLTEAGRRALGSGSFTFTITYVNGATRTQTIIIDSADRVPTTGEGSVNSIAAIILLTSAAFVFAAKKLREEEQ